MSDVQFIFAILGALYLWECACWLRRGGVAFSTWAGRHWRLQHPATMLGNQSGGFLLAAPLPPLGIILTANQLPVSLGPEGVLFFVSPNLNPGWRPPQSGRFLTWEEAGRLRVEGKKLMLGKERVYAAPTITIADHLLTALASIAKRASEQRSAAIKKLLRAGLDTKQIEARRDDFFQQVRPIRYLANGLFALVFGVAPLLITFVGLKLVWLGLLVLLLGLTITTATLFARLHRSFYPAATEDRFTQTLIIALAPASTMRAHDVASRPLLENFHPLAVAKNLLAEEDFCRLARRVLLDLRHPALPTCPNPQPPAVATELFYRRILLEVTEAWLRENKFAPDDLCTPPAAVDASCLAYCPRCEAQFTSSSGSCSDCGGLALVTFRKPS